VLLTWFTIFWLIIALIWAFCCSGRRPAETMDPRAEDACLVPLPPRRPSLLYDRLAGPETLASDARDVQSIATQLSTTAERYRRGEIPADQLASLAEMMILRLKAVEDRDPPSNQAA
jgi:hypothetical protein